METCVASHPNKSQINAIFGVDRFDLQVLQAIRSKYERDYIGFFRKLSELYGRSEQKREIDATITIIERMVTFLGGVISSGRVAKDDEKRLYEFAGTIEERKRYFVAQASKISNLQRRLTRVGESVGISPEDLNVTKDIIKRGILQARKAAGKSKSMFPSSAKLGEIMSGMKVAAFGPFTPAADLAGGLAKDMFKWFGSMAKRDWETLKERRTDREISRVRPSSAQVQDELGVATAPLFGELIKPTKRERFGKATKEESVAPLVYFFDERAYKTKWTKELLNRIKGVGSTSGSVTGGLRLPGIGDLESLFSAGVVGGFKKAALAGAFAFAGYEMASAIRERQGMAAAGKQQVDAAKNLAFSAGVLGEFVKKEGLKGAAEKLHKSPEQVVKDVSEMRRQSQVDMVAGIKRQEPFGGPLSKLRYIPIIGATDWVARKMVGYKRPEVQSLPTITKQVEKELGYEKPGLKIPKVEISASFEASLKRTLDGVDRLSKSVDSVVKNRESASQTTRPAVQVNQYDSADPLINEYATGRLTVGR
jgi:hypothetical protein